MQFAKTLLLCIPPLILIEDNVSFGRVSGLSMQPTLNPNTNLLKKDLVLLLKFKTNKPKVGDIVVFKSPLDPTKRFVKRIKAVGMDWIEKDSKFEFVPQGHIWVEGEEKYRSVDSKTFGPISIGLVDAKVAYIMYPFSRMQKL